MILSHQRRLLLGIPIRASNNLSPSHRAPRAFFFFSLPGEYQSEGLKMDSVAKNRLDFRRSLGRVLFCPEKSFFVGEAGSFPGQRLVGL